MAPKQTAGPKNPPKEDRDMRLRKQYFPTADQLVFKTAEGGFVPVPIILRKLMRHLSPPQLRVLVYLQTRCSKYFICYPTLEEMAHDLDLAGRRNLTPHIRELEKNKFISTASGGGKKYFLVHHPRVAIGHMVETGQINEDALFEINELLRDLKQDQIEAEPKPKATKSIVSGKRKSK